MISAAALLAAATSAQTGKPTRPTIRQADHVVVEAADPRPLFDFFTGLLQLPVAWPFSDTKAFTGGGFGTGNLSIEIVRSGDRTAQARYASLALEPYSLPDCIAELKTRGIPFSAPAPHVSVLPDNSQGALWTTVVLTELSRPGMSAFLYAYSPKFLNIHVRRNQMAGELALKNGGPLGVTSVREIVIITPDLKRDEPRWRKLLFPVVPSPGGVFTLRGGPAIRLVAGRANGIERLVFGIHSLGRAKAFLEREKILGNTTAAEIAISPARVQGLNIRLTEK